MSHSTAREKERPYTSPLPKGEVQEGKMPGWYCDDLLVVSPGAVLLGKVQWKAFRKKCCQSNFCWKCYFDTSGHIVLIIAFSKVTSSLQCSALMIFQTKLQSFSLRVNFSSTFYLTWENRERKKTFDWPRLPAGCAGFAKTFQILLPFPCLEGNPQASHLLERGGPTLQGTQHFSLRISGALERWPKWGKQHILAGSQKSEQPWQVSFVQGKHFAGLLWRREARWGDRQKGQTRSGPCTQGWSSVFPSYAKWGSPASSPYLKGAFPKSLPCNT